jgi:mannose-6-phosphate isomerase
MRRRIPTLAEAAAQLGGWLREDALPLWTTAGLDAAQGGFHEALSPEGQPWPGPRRSRVQTRQVWVCATVAEAGFGAAYGELAGRAYDAYRGRYRRADGLFAYSADAEGRILEARPALYEQAFTLLALSALHRLRPHDGYAAEAHALGEALEGLRHGAGGWRETGAQPFQANAHMHLLEAALAWEAAGEGDWARTSDAVAELALRRFVEPATPMLREFFTADWSPLPEAEGQIVEPGHQFEWATLLDRWGSLRRRDDARALARGLYRTGRRGVSRATGVAINALGGDLAPRDAGARLWPQTERLKAALLFADEAEAVRAAAGLARFLDTPRRGGWRDRMTAKGGFAPEPAPATSLYHLVGAILPLMQAGAAQEVQGQPRPIRSNFGADTR